MIFRNTANQFRSAKKTLKEVGLKIQIHFKSSMNPKSNKRPVVAGVAMAPPDFGRSVNPISTRGADYAHQIILAPPDFQTFLRP